LHEVFLVMQRRWDDYDPERPLRPWLFGIAFRVAAAQRRQASRELYRERLEAEDLADLPDALAANAEEHRLLLKALTTIPLERRAVVVMHDGDEMAMRVIAEQLSIPLFTAYSRLRVARRELNAALYKAVGGNGRAG
jgi:RNA polymerase sigma-70 factor (ECF subfamily)